MLTKGPIWLLTHGHMISFLPKESSSIYLAGKAPAWVLQIVLLYSTHGRWSGNKYGWCVGSAVDQIPHPQESSSMWRCVEPNLNRWDDALVRCRAGRGGDGASACHKTFDTFRYFRLLLKAHSRPQPLIP